MSADAPLAGRLDLLQTTMSPSHDGHADQAAPPAALPPTTAASGAAGEQLIELNALLGRGTSYTGKLHFEGRIRIEGRFSGEIRGDDILVIGEGADVDGIIVVGVCIVTGGRVHANIQARDAIELHVPAVVKGDLHAPAIFIDRGVQFEGNCKMAPVPEPSPTPAPPRGLPPPKPPPARAGKPAAAGPPAAQPLAATSAAGERTEPEQPGQVSPTETALAGAAAAGAGTDPTTAEGGSSSETK